MCFTLATRTFSSACRKAGVKFVAADMPEANEMVVGIMAVIAEGERKMISARTKAALAAAKARGVKLGGFRGVHFSDDARKAGPEARKGVAKARAADLRPIIAEIQAAGITSLGKIAAELTARRVPARRPRPLQDRLRKVNPLESLACLSSSPNFSQGVAASL